MGRRRRAGLEAPQDDGAAERDSRSAKRRRRRGGDCLIATGGMVEALRDDGAAIGGDTMVEAPRDDGAAGWVGRSYFYQIRLNLIQFRHMSAIFS